MFLLYEAECHWIVCSFFCHSFQFPSDATMFSLAVENIPFRCLYFCCCFLKRSQMLHYTCGRVVQRRERNEVLQEWEWMTDEHRNTVGSNTDSFRKAVFFVIVVLGWFFWVFLVSFFLRFLFWQQWWILANATKWNSTKKRMQHQQNSLLLEDG